MNRKSHCALALATLVSTELAFHGSFTPPGKKRGGVTPLEATYLELVQVEQKIDVEKLGPLEAIAALVSAKFEQRRPDQTAGSESSRDPRRRVLSIRPSISPCLRIFSIIEMRGARSSSNSLVS
jgi:hypothetical protein